MSVIYASARLVTSCVRGSHWETVKSFSCWFRWMVDGTFSCLGSLFTPHASFHTHLSTCLTIFHITCKRLSKTVYNCIILHDIVLLNILTSIFDHRHLDCLYGFTALGLVPCSAATFPQHFTNRHFSIFSLSKFHPVLFTRMILTSISVFFASVSLLELSPCLYQSHWKGGELTTSSPFSNVHLSVWCLSKILVNPVYPTRGSFTALGFLCPPPASQRTLAPIIRCKHCTALKRKNFDLHLLVLSIT